jgi:hypothetical protein
MIELLLTAVVAVAPCVDNGADHGRLAVKTRSAPPSLPDSDLLTVANVLAWSVPHVTGWNETAIVVAEEHQIVHVRAYVRLFKCESDGDYHLEVADSGRAKAPRVIIEAPPSQPEIRAELEALLGGRPSHKGMSFNGRAAVPIDWWGYRFLDLDHQSTLIDKKTKRRRSMAQLKKGHAHGSADVGTIWEPGHPILQIQRWETR